MKGQVRWKTGNLSSHPKCRMKQYNPHMVDRLEFWPIRLVDVKGGLSVQVRRAKVCDKAIHMGQRGTEIPLDSPGHGATMGRVRGMEIDYPGWQGALEDGYENEYS